MKQIHEYAKFFPPIEGEEFRALCQDVRERGLLNPIVLKDDKILDGVNRAKACEKTGTRPKYENFNGGDALEYVIAQNVLRRHLSPSQRAVLALELEKQFALDAKLHPTPRTTSEGKHPGTKKKQTIERRKNAAGVRAAKALHVGHASVEIAKRLAKQAPHLIPAVRSGKISITEALIQHRNNRAEEYTRKDREKAKREHLQKNNRQVAEFLEATKAFVVALKVASVGAERFAAKEAKTFVRRKLDEVRRLIDKLEADIGA